MTEAEQRARVVECAHGWIDTPYHHMARKKAAGVDCAQILIAVFAEAGLLEPFNPGHYPRDWMLHRDGERYLEIVTRYCPHEVTGNPQPGDIAVWKIGRCFSHGGIVTAWPSFIHAYLPAGRVLHGRADELPELPRRECRVFSFWSPQ